VATIFLTDGQTPPYAVATLDLVVGLVCLVLVGQALRDPRRPIRLLVGLRILSAVTTLPAFFAHDVPVAAKAAAAAIVIVTAVGVSLTSRDARSLVSS
jgi:hypothetical protein